MIFVCDMHVFISESTRSGLVSMNMLCHKVYWRTFFDSDALAGSKASAPKGLMTYWRSSAVDTPMYYRYYKEMYG